MRIYITFSDGARHGYDVDSVEISDDTPIIMIENGMVAIVDPKRDNEEDPEDQ